MTLCDMCKTNYACFLKCCSCFGNETEQQQKVKGDEVLNEVRIMKTRAIILDCTRCNFIDESGAKCLKEIVDTYAKANVKLLLTNCNGNFLFVSFLNFGYNRMPSLV